jgi:hypothetical protein
MIILHATLAASCGYAAYHCIRNDIRFLGLTNVICFGINVGFIISIATGK